MTVTLPGSRHAAGDARIADRFRLHRAGILNVWQYDDQEFLLADGRMLLRGANGAGKSKTLEMLLPFALDGDKARITASARHHTSLLWLMTDGYDGQARVGYVWVEFLRPGADGEVEAFTCGVGIRASASARTATAWHFTTSQRIGHDLMLEDDGGPLSRPRLEEAIGAAGQVFDKAAAYKEHVGRALFGLEVGAYDEVLRLLYWLRQPQIGEDIEPTRLAGQLAQALPQLDELAVKAAGDTFDELAAFGEQIERRTAAAEALGGLAAAYSRYARSAVAERGRALIDAVGHERRLRSGLRRRESELAELATRRADGQRDLEAARHGADTDRARIAELSASPEADAQRRLGELEDLADRQAGLADSARTRAGRSEAEHGQRIATQRRATEAVQGRTRDHAQRVRDADDRKRDLGVRHTAPVLGVLDSAELAGPDQAAGLHSALLASHGSLVDAGAAVGRRQAEALVLREALARLAESQRLLVTAERVAAEAEQRWEQAREHRSRADQDAVDEGAALRDRLSAWVAEDAALTCGLPVELTPETVPALPGLVREATDPELGRLRSLSHGAASRRDAAEVAIAELDERHAAIDAESDPPPPGPALPRSPRPDGSGLWRLVDFADDVEDTTRARIEAALQGAGLLDAWVRPDGAVLDADSLDVVVPSGPALEGRTLADVLRPDLPSGSDVEGGVVEAVLRRVRLAETITAAEGAAVGTDGTWCLAPLHGRADKERAQYVGATARAHERQRQLDEVDALLAEARDRREAAVVELDAIALQIDSLTAWVRRLPSSGALSAAWVKVDERRAVERAEEVANETAQRQAHETRRVHAGVRAEVHDLGLRHELPIEPEALAATEERLRSLAADLASIAGDVPSIVRDLDRWSADQTALAEAAARAEIDRADADQLTTSAETTTATLEELRSSVGAEVRELEARIREVRGSLDLHDATARRLDTEVTGLAERVGSARTAAETAADELAGHREQRAAVLQGLADVAGVPGLLESAFEASVADETPAEVPDRGVLLGAPSSPSDASVPAVVVTAAETLGARAAADEPADVNSVWRAYHEATSGPAADHEPTVGEYADLVAVTGRGEAGEQPIGQLAARVAAAVTRDRALLTERERERFERHVLGELGDAIRRCRLEADELVEAMNGLLAEVTTSQGIRVKLDWRLRDDVPTDARQAVTLLGQPVGALLPDERTGLRDALHRLIEAARSEAPELAYGEHLSAALDYRSWFAFRIRYTRPEGDGAWLDLHRRSPLSQGEQKVLCYLPLFAAAAAHFTSLAGAAPHAPRLVLLDDAFPKIDVRTHPLLFGLLVQLDLDFVITSERLWGDHDTVPSLAIYEALRDPSQRGIAQYEYRWDGRQLRALG